MMLISVLIPVNTEKDMTNWKMNSMVQGHSQQMMVIQLIQRFPAVMEPIQWLPSQKPAIWHYLEPDQPSSHLHILGFILILSHNYFIDLASALFPRAFTTKILYAFLIALILVSCYKASYFWQDSEHLTLSW
jgi:hypothetical protein